MDFEPHNFPALVKSVIRSDPRLAEPLKEVFAAYARNEDLEEIWARIDHKFHQSLRLILDDLNEIDDPVSLDQEVQVLLQAIDQALAAVEDEAAMAPDSDQDVPAVKKVKKKKAKKAAARLTKKPAAKKAAGKKKAPAAKKKTAKAAGKKAVKKASKPAAKKAKPAAKKAVKKKAAVKKAKPAVKKKKKKK